MAKKKLDAKYTVARFDDNGQNRTFAVTKLVLGVASLDQTYIVTQAMMAHAEPGSARWTEQHFICNCPNSRSGRHIDDKHGMMVKDWLERKEPKKGYYDGAGVYHAK
jgi:hypothetical protein